MTIFWWLLCLSEQRYVLSMQNWIWRSTTCQYRGSDVTRKGDPELVYVFRYGVVYEFLVSSWAIAIEEPDYNITVLMRMMIMVRLDRADPLRRKLLTSSENIQYNTFTFLPNNCQLFSIVGLMDHPKRAASKANTRYREPERVPSNSSVYTRMKQVMHCCPSHCDCEVQLNAPMVPSNLALSSCLTSNVVAGNIGIRETKWETKPWNVT